jgi:hypothetical protein
VTVQALWWVIGVALATGVAVAMLGRGNEVLLGVAGPSVVAGVSWILMMRAWAREPVSLLPLMLRAFAAKALVFVGYVSVVAGVLDVRLTPFALSFTAAFVATYTAEAFGLWRLMAPVLKQ